MQLDEVEWIEPFAAEVAEELDGGGGGGVEEDGDGGDRFVGLFFFFSPPYIIFFLENPTLYYMCGLLPFLVTGRPFSLLKKKAQDVGFVFLI
jgi:hypothetical protein